MKLEFSSAEELTDFLYVMQAFFVPVAPEATPGVSLTFPALDQVGTSNEVAFDTPPTTDAQAPANAPTAEPQKRKRRTKAEIEADEKAAKGARAGEIPPQGPAPADASDTGTSAQPQGANPFAQAVTITGQGPVETETTSLPAGDSAAATGTTDGDPAETVVTPFQHLTRAREFIAKHGMPKYNETFTKAGLDPNVMGYTAYQRGVHMATMDEVDKA